MDIVFSDSNAPRLTTRETADGWIWELFDTAEGSAVDSSIVGYSTQLSAWEAGSNVLDLWLLQTAAPDEVDIRR